MSTIQDRAIQRVEELVSLANEKYNIDLPMPQVQFSVKGCRVAGYARKVGPMYFLNLNMEACEKYTDEILNEVIPHEMAHLVCFFNPVLGKNHNAGWKNVCRALGGTGSRTHSMRLTPAKNIRRWLYRDSAGKVREITTNRHNKMRKLGVQYKFRDNGGVISASCYIQPKTNQKVTDMNTETDVAVDNQNETVESQTDSVETEVADQPQVNTEDQVQDRVVAPGDSADSGNTESQDRYRKSTGRPSKAVLTRQIIREMQDSADKSEIFTAIQERVGFTRAMARHYYYANLKILQKQQAGH